MVYFFRKGLSTLSCETRLSAEAAGYELITTRDGHSQVEVFPTVAALLAREHELLQAWRAVGWREIGGAAPKTGKG